MNDASLNLHDAMNAQLRYAAAILESAAINGYSDDGFDDIQAALDVSRVLVLLDYELQADDTTAFDQYVTMPLPDDNEIPTPLNLYSDHVLRVYYGTDGIAPEIHDAFLRDEEV